MRLLIPLISAMTTATAANAAQPLLIAAASDLAPLTAAFEAGFARTNGVKVRFTLASSGSLARQIENGAPYDVFLSASDQYVKDLSRTGYVEPATVTVYALGRIALWSRDGSVRTLADLEKPQVKHIAIANPEYAPYGLAARQLLERRGLWNKISDKLVYAENVRQSLQYAESGNADAVITSWTLLKGSGVLLPSESHDPIRQAGAVIKGSTQVDAARKFLVFLTSAEGRKILEEGGLFRPR